MNKNITRRKKLLQIATSLSYIDPDDIPEIDLYMDQLTTFMEDKLNANKRSDDDKTMTKTMINNYAKNNLLPSPEKKRYSKDHLLMLIFIGSFHGALALVALVGYAVVGVLVPFVISRRTRRSGDAFRAEFGDMNAYFMDSLRGLREILQYDMGQERGEQIGIRTQKMSESEEEVKRQGGLSSAVTGFLILFFTLVMLLMAGVLYQQGSIGFEGVLIPVITMASSFGPVLAVANLGSGLAQTLAA